MRRIAHDLGLATEFDSGIGRLTPAKPATPSQKPQQRRRRRRVPA
jgi:hypothetical protein